VDFRLTQVLAISKFRPFGEFLFETSFEVIGDKFREACSLLTVKGGIASV
jgi:hypothetical protein